MKHSLVYSLMMILLLISGSTAMAAMSHNGAHAAQTMPEASTGEFTKEYMKAMDAMHVPMMRGITDSDPDAAFVKGMLWHHRGAVDMAQIQLKYGKDPEMKKLARQIIDAQDPEINLMQEWLKKKGVPE